MKNVIINYLKDEYNAQAIILHGSRARGSHNEKSDWDLLVFTNKTNKSNGGVQYKNADLDIKIISLPIKNIENFIASYPQSLQYFEILLDTKENLLQSISPSILNTYKKEFPLTTQKKEAIDHHLQRMITRLEVYQNQPEIFWYHISSFYIKSIRYWFEYQKRWSQPIVEALKILKEEDKLFYNQIQQLIESTNSSQNKIQAAKLMKDIILQK